MALSLGKLTILVGAGVLGSVLAKEGGISNVSDFISGALKTVFRQVRRDDPSPSTGKPQNDSLLAQVNNLRKELELLASNRPVTIITGSRSGATSYGVPVIVVIVVGYGYIWWKGWKLSDMMFATRRSLSDACSSISKQLDQVSSSVSAAKRHLSSRIDRVDCNIDECAELTSATRDEVSELRGDLRTFSLDVESVQRVVQTLETKIGRIEGKQDFTTQGILMLCDVVQTLENGRTAAYIQGSSSSSSRPALELPQITSTSRTASLPPKVLPLEPPAPSLSSSSSSNASPKVLRPSQSRVSVSGFKEIQEISESLNDVAGSEVPNGTCPVEDTKNNGSSSSGRFGWKFPGLNASFLSRTHSATISFK